MLRRNSVLAFVLTTPTVVVGGGAAGTLAAARFGLENMKVVMLEEGPDVTKALKWHREAPAAALLHRAAGRYVSKREATLGDAKVTIETPSVVGGAGIVLGSKAWIRGHELDWKDGAFPLRFEDGGLLLRYKRLESVEGADKHRGTQGRFLVTKAKGVSMIHKDILAGFQKAKLGLINGFNGARGFSGVGAGRSEALIDFSTGFACNAVNQHLDLARQMKRPVTVTPKTKVLRLEFGESGNVQTVVALQNGKEVRFERPDHVVLAAGALNTPQILLNSTNLPASTQAALSKGALWAVRTRTITFKTNNAITLAPATNPIVQAMIAADWWWNRLGWMGSSYDDMLCFAESEVSRKRRGASLALNEAYPDLKIVVQPFMTDASGNLLDEHGVQLRLQLIRPEGRGSVDKDGNVVLGETEEDRAAFEEGMQIINRIVAELTPTVLTPAGAQTTRDTWEGPFGGTVPLGVAVDPETFKLVGTSNVYVTDGSIVPRPLVAESVALSYALTDLCVDRVSRKAPLVV